MTHKTNIAELKTYSSNATKTVHLIDHAQRATIIIAKEVEKNHVLDHVEVIQVIHYLRKT